MSSLGNPAARPDRASVAGALHVWLRRHEALTCALLCLVWFGVTAGLRPLAIPDEGRYVGVAWEMMRSGDWAVPTLNGAPFFHKPPLFYWITAAAMTVFGPDPWAARIGSVVATSLVATALFRFLRRWRDARTGWTAVVVLATTPLFYGSSQYANLDPLVAACVALAILCGADAVLLGERGRPARQALAGAFVAMGCGVLAKGLIGMVLPLLVLLGWGLATARLARVARAVCWGPGWALFLAIALPWFLAMTWRFADFGHYFFVVQHLDRFTSASFNNAQPVWFYPALLALGAAPWTPWGLAALRRGVRTRPDPHGLGALMTVWALVVTVFFSLPRSKPIGYVLPALPPLAFWLAQALGPANVWTLHRRRFVATAAVAATVCVGATAALHFLQPKSQAAIGAQLLARRLPGEPVAFLGNYWFDLPVLAALDTPVWVVDAWTPAELAKDSWRRELADAERFAPDGAVPRRLKPAELPAAFAGARSAWVVGPVAAAGTNPWLASQTLVARHDGIALWHVDSVAAAAPPALEPAP